MNILIVEDEPLAVKHLQRLLFEIAPSHTVVGVVGSIHAGKNFFLQQPAELDLILSDIQLSDGISFDIFESASISAPIIFTTAYDEYAIRAFKLNSIDYLLKPVDGAELAKALQKYQNLTRSDLHQEAMNNLASSWGSAQRAYKERFLAVHKQSLIPVDQTQIACFQKEELIFLLTKTGERLISEYQTLDEVEALVNPDYFFRANRQYLIRIDQVSRITTTHKGLTVTLREPFPKEIDISREKAAAFKTWISR